MGAYFTVAELLAIWQSSVDSLYSQPIVDAGEDGGLEAYTQAFAQYERVSQAIVRSTQALYVLPHSSQLAAPAPGDAKALVAISVARDSAFQFPIVFAKGQVLVEEEAVDHGESGGVLVRTGRRYAFNETVAFEPGEVGPKYIPSLAEVPGWSHNNPQAQSISAFSQAGGQHNDRATVVAGNGEDVLYAANEYATFLPQMIGQYVRLDGGDNDGKVRRITSYTPPAQTPIEHGGAVGLAQEVLLVAGVGAAYVVGERVTDSVTGAAGVLLHYNAASGACVVQRASGFFAVGSNLVGETSSVATAIATISTAGMLVALYLGVPLGMWWAGETVTQAVSGAVGTFLYAETSWAILIPVSGTFDAVNPATGGSSGVVLTPVLVGVEPSLVDAAGTAAWHVLDWELDLGFSATNPTQPAGGTLGVLDEIGRERAIPRADNETDDEYRRRVARIPDVVSPNAIRRACSRVLTPHGWTAVLREVGTVQFPGFFFDIPSADAPTYSSAWDVDPGVRPADRFRTWLDYAEFRAFFLIGVPATGYGEFGFAYDAHPLGFFDIGPLDDYYDGFPAKEAALNKLLWNDIVARKAGGVGFDFYKQ